MTISGLLSVEDPEIWREDCLYFSDIKEVLVSDLGLNLSVCGYGQLSDLSFFICKEGTKKGHPLQIMCLEQGLAHSRLLKSAVYPPTPFHITLPPHSGHALKC